MELSEKYIGCIVELVQDMDGLGAGAVGKIIGTKSSLGNYYIEVIKGTYIYDYIDFVAYRKGHTCQGLLSQSIGYEIHPYKLKLLSSYEDTLILLIWYQ